MWRVAAGRALLQGLCRLTAEVISDGQREQISAQTLACLRRAEALFDLSHQPIPVHFDLRGRAAGMYRVTRQSAVIRYNPFIFARYFEHGLQVTVPHEVAHYVTDRVYGLPHVRPHGGEWQSIMRQLGVEPRATAYFDLSGLPIRRQRRFTYQCDCDTHELSACRHNRVNQGRARYHCRQCGSVLVAV